MQFVQMRYTLSCDLPGRLRVRFGRDAFTSEEGYGIAERLSCIQGVEAVTTCPANGSVLVVYSEDACDSCREALLDTLSSFDRAVLPTSKPSDSQLSREVDWNFQNGLVRLVCGRILRKLFLPAPIRQLYAVVSAAHFIRLGLRALFAGKLTVEVLDATAIAASLIRSSFDSASSVMFLLRVSALLEEYTHARSRLALEQSLSLNVDEVWLVEGGSETLVPFKKVKAGDSLRIRTGSMIPVDGTVVSGEAAVNESTMTGESKLALKDAGSSVFAGTVVEDGNVVVKVRSTGADTRISSIVSMIDESEKHKAGLQSRAERLADAIVPYSFLAFFAVLAVTRNVTKALAVLMVDYSCAIKLSTPVAVMSAMREAASRGMVVKGGRYLEVMAEADTIVFDKTGTLTTAVPSVSRIIELGDMSQGEILRLAACLEEHFPHSMARAVVETARKSGVHHSEENHSEVRYVVAHGIVSGVDGKEVALGSEHFIFEDEGVARPPRLRQRISRMAKGCSVIYLAVDRVAQGAICIEDPVREESAEVVRLLQDAGFKRVIMLTGDAEGAASATAKRLGISEYRSQVLPQDKASIIQGLKDEGRCVVMVGDGVNDSPALATADASVAMVDASDIAREVADITLLRASLFSLLDLRRLSVLLMERINRDYRVIVFFNTALIAFGIAGVLQPAASAFAHNASTMAITAANMRRLLPQQAS